MDPIALGRASIRLELLLNKALFIGREGFRLALIRATTTTTTTTSHPSTNKKDAPHTSRNIHHIAWLSIPVCGMLSILALLFHLYSWRHLQVSETDTIEQQQQSLLDYKISGMMYCLAAFVE